MGSVGQRRLYEEDPEQHAHIKRAGRWIIKNRGLTKMKDTRERGTVE